MTMHVCGFEILTRNFFLFNDIESTNVSKKQNDNNHWDLSRSTLLRRQKTIYGYAELSKSWQIDILQVQWGSTLEDWRLRQIKKSEDKHWPTTLNDGNFEQLKENVVMLRFAQLKWCRWCAVLSEAITAENLNLTFSTFAQLVVDLRSRVLQF